MIFKPYQSCMDCFTANHQLEGPAMGPCLMQNKVESKLSQAMQDQQPNRPIHTHQVDKVSPNWSHLVTHFDDHDSNFPLNVMHKWKLTIPLFPEHLTSFSFNRFGTSCGYLWDIPAFCCKNSVRCTASCSQRACEQFWACFPFFKLVMYFFSSLCNFPRPSLVSKGTLCSHQQNCYPL